MPVAGRCLVRADRNVSRRYAVSILLGLALAVPASAQDVSSRNAVNRAGATVSSVRIDNFGQVNERYYRGAQPKGSDYADLHALGIRTVVNLTDDGDATEAGLVEAQGMKLVRIPMTTRVIPTAEQIAQFLRVVGDSASQPVYVHCQGGRHRTGVMTAIYRMATDGWDAPKAFAEMKQYRFGADFLHPKFKKFVYAFHPEVSRVAEAAGTR
jgi:protein tyrosine/serine phosphatase